MTTKKVRRHTPEFRTAIAQQMLAGADVMALSRQHQLARSMMYRWRDAYRKNGAAGLASPVGRTPSTAAAMVQAKGGEPADEVERKLRLRVAELERKVGQQAVAIDFFKAVFRRLDARPKTRPSGDGKSMPKSDA